MDLQSIRFASIDGRRVAYATVGTGPPLIMGGWWMSHLELDWGNARFRGFVQALGRYRTVIRYDRPGTGLSDDGGEPPAVLDDEVGVLAGVLDAIGPEPIDAFAASSGGPVVAAYAAVNPTRVRSIVFYGSYASGNEIADPAARKAMLELLESHWGLGSRVFADVFMPTGSGEDRAAFVAYQRESASTELAAKSLSSVYSFDVVDQLGEITAPTLVLHRRDDRAIPFELGRNLAARIPGAAFVALEGSDHFPWWGDTRGVVESTLEGLGVTAPEIALPLHPPPAPDPPAEPVETDLSPRELEVLRLIAIGLSDREIADQLVLSPHTIHRHVANIRTKLRLPSRAAAAAHAARLGLL